jgi:hypothetical protein
MASDELTCRTHPLAEQLNLFPLPVPNNVTPRPLTGDESIRIDTLSQLQFVSLSSAWSSIITHTD